MLSERKVIIGTDWWTDCDDVAAMRIFALACRRGVFAPLGAVLDACMDDSAPSLNAFLTSEGLSNLPIGVDHRATDFGGNPPYQKPLCAFPHTVASNADCEDAVRFYRRLLSETSGVEIIELGYTQALAALLDSEGDDLSPLSGRQLVAQRVTRAWVMAGNWENNGSGVENNFARNARAREGAAKFARDWPTRVTFLGWEVASGVIVGAEAVRRAPTSPLAIAFRAHGSESGRSAWDPMLVYLAMTGDANEAGFDARRGVASVDARTGQNFFEYRDDGPHEYVVKRWKDEEYARILESLL